MEIKDVLDEIIDKEVYKNDYDSITSLLICEKLEYEEAITALKTVKNFFEIWS